MAHSWSGNLVSCRNWSNFWLNEGVTIYLEREVVRKLHGEDQFKLDSLINYTSLKEYVMDQGCDHIFTSLTPHLEGIDPDDAFSPVPYGILLNLNFNVQF